MTINTNNALIGLSILGGTSAYSSALSSTSSTDTPAVTKAKAAFTMAPTTPPWKLDDPSASTSTSAQVTAIQKLLSIVDEKTYDRDSTLDNLPDVKATFTIYKALDRLQTLAESAASTSTSAAQRASLEKTFAKGLSDLQSYIGSADTDLLTLNFGTSASQAKTIAVDKPDVTGAVAGNPISTKEGDAIAGLTGNEIFQVTMTKGTTTQTVNVDLSQSTQPPTLDSVAAALNAAIGAQPQLDANGDPVLDADGKPVSEWQSNFTVKYDSDSEKWGLVFNPSGIEKVSLEQVGAGDSIMVASGETRKDSTTDASVYRFGDIDGSLSWERLGSINAVDAAATAQAQTAAAASTTTTTSSSSSSGSTATPDYTVDAATSARGMVTDADGFSYVVGTTNGDLGSQVTDGSNDMFLTKIDSEGQVVWQRNLGAAGSASGSAVTIAPNGDIVVAGSVSGDFNNSDPSQTDLLVARFSSTGNELSTTAIRQTGTESANAVTVGNDGSIYIAGRASTGGGDAVIVKLDSTGKFVERRTIDSGGNDMVNSLAIDGSGNLLALTNEDGVAKLRQIDASSLSNDLNSVTLGNVEARAISVSDTGEIAVVGAASTPVGGDQVNAISGSRDAFVTRIDSGLTSASTTYIGTSDDDQADSVTWLNGTLYVGGRTAGTLSGTKAGTVDGFIARVDGDTGAVQTVSQWGLVASTVEPVRITTLAGGDNALGALGLHSGTLNPTTSATLVSETSLRAGDEFSVMVDGGDARKITIDENETMTTLAAKIKKITGTNATVTTSLVDGQTTLKITVAAGHTLVLGAGGDGKDALAKLGLSPVKLSTPKVKTATDAKVTPGGAYSLALTSALSLTDSKAASVALTKVKSALSMIQTAYRSLYWDSGKASLVNGTLSTGSGSAYQQKQLANYQAALTRLTSS
ncbi:SBBP repeat-containing protein [Novosphingobium sp. PhB165]|uniref:SBBP repeat-containing protein n=1 Tax=Novosphingobium sp. PhB165 TaxID=2485105 RepID=UPI00104F3A46|nr:SBBP repeat-containing protein [Novosphingobium sp. PhB165]